MNEKLPNDHSLASYIFGHARPSLYPLFLYTALETKHFNKHFVVEARTFTTYKLSLGEYQTAAQKIVPNLACLEYMH